MSKEANWSAYMQMAGSKIPIFLKPLEWKGGDQLSNLTSMINFFDGEIPDRIKILIYKSMCGSGKCVEGDTLILTSKGIIRIEDIVKPYVPKQKTIESIIEEESSIDFIGTNVKSLNISNIRLEDDIISNIFDLGEDETIDITTKSGFNIKCTSSHKLIVIDDNCNIIFKEAKDILIGDNIAIARGTEIYGKDVDLSDFYQSDFYRKYKKGTKDIIIPDRMNEDLAELLGYAISEGCRGDRNTYVFGDEDIIRDRMMLIVRGLGIVSHEVFDSIRNIYDGVSINSVIFGDFLKYLGYIDGSKNKEIPWSILQSSKRVQIAFLKALFSGDGYIGNENKLVIEYYTISKKLAEQLHIMLLNIGIFSSLKEKPAICVKEDGERKDCGICYRISIYGREDIIKYIHTIGFIQDYKKSRCDDILRIFESKDFSYKSRTIKGSHIRLNRIHEEFKKLGKKGRIVKTWKEDIELGNKIWTVERHKQLSSNIALKERGFLTGISEWINGYYAASKRQILKLLKSMKECYYVEDFKYLYNIATSNIEFDPIIDIKKGRGHIYDLTIRDNHSYIGNGFINHNSLTLLHLPKEMEGRAIIVTPFKNLQRQYLEDYYKGNKYVLKKDGTKLKVAVILGRNNFPCRWLEEQYDRQQKIIEMNKKFGKYMYVDDEILNIYKYDSSAANKYLPCTRTLRPIGKGRRETRWQVASTCPYWIPTPTSKDMIDKWSNMPEDDVEGEFEGEGEIIGDGAGVTRLDTIKDKVKCSEIKFYESVGWDCVGVFIRDEKDKFGKPCSEVCPYYEQFYSYVDADVIVMNDAKWGLETQMGRKPKVNIEILDEGDYWLDNRSTTIELMRSTIDRIVPLDKKMQTLKMNALAKFDMYFTDIKSKVDKISASNDLSIIDAKSYIDLYFAIKELLKEYKKHNDDDNTEQKILDMDTIIRYANRASLSYREGKRGETKIIKVFIPYPDAILRELLGSSSRNIVITSGTIHNKYVLSNLFGINADNYEVELLEGRKQSPGRLTCMNPDIGKLKVNHIAWQSPIFKESYNRTLNYILDNLKVIVDKRTGKPGEGKILCLTPAKKYAEGLINRDDVFIDFAKSRDQDDNMKLMLDTSLSDYVDNKLEDVRKIKPSDIQLDGDVLRTDKQIIVSTRMIRGTDLRDNLCRAVIILKYPIADLSNGYNQALKKRFGENIYWSIIRDKAARDSVQYVSRGLRHQMDWCLFSSPDEMAFNNVFRLFDEMSK